MIGKNYLLFILAAMALFSCPYGTQAVDQELAINEIMYDTPAGQEWVELKNTGVNDVVIDSNWRFSDGSNHLITFFQGPNNSAAISPKGFAILADDPQVFLASHPNFNGPIFKVSMSLNNEGDTLKLSADKGENWFSQVAYSKDQGAAGDGKTLEQDSTFGVRNSESWRPSFVAGGTPNRENSTLADLPQYSRNVYINEISAHPASGAENEFIELYNSGETEVDLSGWKLDDVAHGGSGEYEIENGTKIAAKGYLVFYKTQTKISLNDGGDFARLIWPDGREAGAIPYPKIKKDFAYIRTNEGSWQLTAKISPMLENTLVFETSQSPAEPVKNSTSGEQKNIVLAKSTPKGISSDTPDQSQTQLVSQNKPAETLQQKMLTEIISSSDGIGSVDTLHERRFNNIIAIITLISSLLLIGLITRWMWQKRYL